MKLRVRELFPPDHPVRGTWRAARDFGLVKWHLMKGRPDAVVAFGAGGLGDSLLCTAVLRALRARGARVLWMLSPHQELFSKNPDVDAVLPCNDELIARLQNSGLNVVRTHYNRNHWEEGRDDPPKGHIIEMMCRAAGIHAGEVELRPRLHLTPAEIAAGRLAPRQIAVQTTGRSARFFMRTKEWFPERFVEAARRLPRDCSVVQIGHPDDPAIPGAIDQRGRTSLRRTAAILANADLFIGLVGFPMHLARAVDCPAVIVYGGRELPTQSGYSAFVNLQRSPACSPCWLWHRCDHDMRCMTDITADEVAAAALQQLARPRHPLPIDVVTL